MHKLGCFQLSAAVLAFAALVAVEARSAELEGALQYPPASVGQDAQPPPAKMVPQLVTPRRIELGISGSISEAPADLGTWSTAGNWKRRLRVAAKTAWGAAPAVAFSPAKPLQPCCGHAGPVAQNERAVFCVIACRLLSPSAPRSGPLHRRARRYL